MKLATFILILNIASFSQLRYNFDIGYGFGSADQNEYSINEVVHIDTSFNHTSEVKGVKKFNSSFGNGLKFNASLEFGINQYFALIGSIGYSLKATETRTRNSQLFFQDTTNFYKNINDIQIRISNSTHIPLKAGIKIKYPLSNHFQPYLSTCLYYAADAKMFDSAAFVQTAISSPDTVFRTTYALSYKIKNPIGFETRIGCLYNFNNNIGVYLELFATVVNAKIVEEEQRIIDESGVHTSKYIYYGTESGTYTSTTLANGYTDTRYQEGNPTLSFSNIGLLAGISFGL